MSADFAPTAQNSRFDRVAAPRAGLLRRWLRRPDPASCDARTGLLNRHAFLAAADALAAGPRCARATLVVFEFDDLRASADLWGDRAVHALVAQLARGLRRAAGRHGLAGRTGPTQFAVLLPRLCRQSGIDAVNAVFGQPCRLELDWHGEEIVCVPEVAAEVWEGEPEGIAPLYEHLCLQLARHRERRVRHRDFIRRERERHSRPFGCTVSESHSVPVSG